MTKHTVTTLEAMAFGATMFGSACINNLFVTYYMDLFCGVVSVSSGWFFVGQIVFMLWNALNDFVFGWFSDKGASGSNDSTPTLHPVHSRARAIRIGGFIWGVAFLLIWFPPPASASDFLKGLHFALSLCFYDGMLSYVEVNHSALLAEICTSNRGRATCNMYSAIFAVLGSASSYFGHVYWHGGDLGEFRKVCFVVSILSVVSFEFTSFVISRAAPALEPSIKLPSSEMKRLNRDPATDNLRSKDGAPDVSAQKRSNSDGTSQRRNLAISPSEQQLTEAVVSAVNKKRTIFGFLSQICRQRNFVIFVGIQCLQNFDCTFEKNFFHIFLRSFAAGSVSTSVQGVILSASFIVPWLGMVLITPIIQKYGVYACVKQIFRMRLLIALVSVGLVHHSPLVGCMCLLINRVTSESICRLCPLVISHLIDEDKYLHHKLRDRASVRSASIVGASQVLGKFSQSLAPMLGYAFVEFDSTLGNAVKAATEASQTQQGYADDPLMVSDDDLVADEISSASPLFFGCSGVQWCDTNEALTFGVCGHVHFSVGKR
eukprot:INCI15694.1.p1 GENE.INCI15694.1~~INCI15694.1.p1  ORF type:complete len:545 (+),score=59.62 INCI15694.1:225-1859(+)